MTPAGAKGGPNGGLGRTSGDRFIDRGAVVAAYVGTGMAVVMALSFLMVIPIEPIYLVLGPLSGLLIGYYANQRSERLAGPLRRIVANALFAGVVTGLTLAILLLAVKALFFFADNGYRGPDLGGGITCQPGADCVYRRYLADGRGPDLTSAGVADTSSFASFYWSQQLETAGTLLAVTLAGALGGGLLYGAARPRAGTARGANRA